MEIRIKNTSVKMQVITVMATNAQGNAASLAEIWEVAQYQR
jgi:hypothetical protein